MKRGMLLLMMPLSVAWVGSGQGDLRWSAGEGKQEFEASHVSLDVVARIGGGQPTHVLGTVPLGAGDGVLTLEIDPRGGRFELPHPGVLLQYDEYDSDGEVVFRAGQVVGSLWVETRSDEVAVELDVVLYDEADPEQWRHLARSSLEAFPVEPQPERNDDHHHHDPHHDHVVVGGGCDDGWDEPEDGGGGGGGGGCEGDDFDDGGGGGGCDGDDVGGGGGGDSCQGCEGDAIAAGSSCSRRSPWLARAVSWLPWAFAVFFFHGMRRRWIG